MYLIFHDKKIFYIIHFFLYDYSMLLFTNMVLKYGTLNQKKEKARKKQSNQRFRKRVVCLYTIYIDILPTAFDTVQNVSIRQQKINHFF